MKIGIGQINTTTGDFDGNCKKILDAALRLKELGADCAVFSELALCGIYPKDKVFSRKFLEKNSECLEVLARDLPIPAFVGFVRSESGALDARNSIAFLEGGKVNTFYDKHLLPNYGIFRDKRYFDKGTQICIVEFKGKRIGLTICEDIWSADTDTAKFYDGEVIPLELLAKENLDVLINASASLWSPENEAARAELLPNVARSVNASLVYCNSIGGNDDMVCAGGSVVLNSRGEYCECLSKFKEDLRVVDLENLNAQGLSEFEKIPEMYDALVMSLGDFVRKSGFSKVLLGLSGGIDSALVATLAADALGAENVTGIALPSKYSSDHSRRDAGDLAKNLGIKFETIAIADLVASAETALAPMFAGRAPDLTEENLQSRSRALLLMAISNKFDAMLLSTGNKSECAVGYATLYGDTCGGFAPIADVYKTDVFALSKYANKNGERIPLNTIIKPPSAELRPDQKDSDSLPEYDILDAILYAYIEGGKSANDIIAAGFDASVVYDVIKKFERTEYKRKQLAPAPRLSIRSLGNDKLSALTDKKSYEF